MEFLLLFTIITNKYVKDVPVVLYMHLGGDGT